MNTNRVTVRYAKALYAFASDEKKAEVVSKDMRLISEIVKIPEFRNMLENPVIFPSKKIAVFEEVMKNKVDNVTLKFFKLLAKNKREAYLDALARNYIDIYRKNNNIKSADLTLTFTPDEELKKDVVLILSQKFKSNIEIATKKDKNIIGGFVLTVDGMQYDVSVATKLKEVKKEMLKAE